MALANDTTIMIAAAPATEAPTTARRAPWLREPGTPSHHRGVALPAARLEAWRSRTTRRS
jgi:hypothetical protein